MKKRVLVRGPALSRSGYGEHVRFLLRSLRPHEHLYDLYLLNVQWGATGNLTDETEERRWIETLALKGAQYVQQKGHFDLSIQVTIPNEWEKIAPVNVGVTAGIETSKVAPEWLSRGNLMDKIITISEHSKNVYETTSYQAQNEATGEVVENYRCETPIEIVHYPVREYEPEEIAGLELDFDFNYLTVAQWGPRKNLDNTIQWFLQEFQNDEVGLVVKTNIAKDCLRDRFICEAKLTAMVASLPDRKCKIYLLHGDLKPSQMTWLYRHDQIKSLISLTHGEGFGLPIFEAAYNGLPIIAPLWSGHVDFLSAPNKKGKMRPMIAKVAYSLETVDPGAVWPGVIQEDSMWCSAHERDYKRQLREVYKNYGRFKSNAQRLQKHVLEEFASEKQHEIFAEETLGCLGKLETSEDWLAEIEDIIKEYE
jgi:glycosyltransferase involved in cell wall biosynthesis